MSDRKDPHRGVLVIGLGRFGEAVARTLCEQGIDVLAVDFDPEIVHRLSADLPNIVQADATSSRALRQVGAEQFERAVVAIATNIESSVLATLALKDDLKIPQVWTKAISKEHAKILERMGTDRVIQPEHEMGVRTAQGLAQGVTDYIRIEEDFALVEMEAPESFLGKPLGQSGIRNEYGITIVSVKPPGGVFRHTDANTVLERGELILIAGTPAQLDRLTDSV
jgi:trk system potassium uptake protein TrkA